MKTWHFGVGGKLVAGSVEVENMDEAASLAARWNKDCADGMRVEIVANAPVVGQASKVRGVF